VCFLCGKDVIFIYGLERFFGNKFRGTVFVMGRQCALSEILALYNII
jgi:hypothetical protein